MEREIPSAEHQEQSADDKFVCRAANVLDASIAGVSPQIVARLDIIRQSAVAGAGMADSDDFFDHGVLYGRHAPLSDDVTVQLDAMRSRAMQRAVQQRQPQDASVPGTWREWIASLRIRVPVSAFASVCILVITVTAFNAPDPATLGSTGSDSLPMEMAEEVLLLASAADIELYENLEFYQWLADNGL